MTPPKDIDVETQKEVAGKTWTLTQQWRTSEFCGNCGYMFAAWPSPDFKHEDGVCTKCGTVYRWALPDETAALLRSPQQETELPSERLRQIERAVWEWQLRGQFHPLTCGTKEKHRFDDIASALAENQTHDMLRPDIRDGAVILVCPTCDYVQTWIPEVVTGALISDGSPQQETELPSEEALRIRRLADRIGMVVWCEDADDDDIYRIFSDELPDLLSILLRHGLATSCDCEEEQPHRLDCPVIASARALISLTAPLLHKKKRNRVDQCCR